MTRDGKVLVVAVSWDGHHPSYCAFIASTLLSAGMDVTVLCPVPADLQRRLARHGDRVKVGAVPEFEPSSGSPRARWVSMREYARALSEAVQRISGGHRQSIVFFTGIDWLFGDLPLMPFVAARLRRWLAFDWSGLLLVGDRSWTFESTRARFARRGIRLPGLGFANRVLRTWWQTFRRRALRASRCTAVAVMNEDFRARLAARVSMPVACLPEFTSLEVAKPPGDLVLRMAAARAKTGRTVVGLVGALAARKGLDLVVELVRSDPHRRFLFVVAGEARPGAVSGELDRALREHANVGENLIYSPISIPTEADFNAVVEACDVVWCAYKGPQASSNVLLKAAAFGKPVISYVDSHFSKDVRAFALGAVLEEWSIEAAGLALAGIGTGRGGDAAAASLRARYLEAHSEARVREALLACCRGPSSAPASPGPG